MRITLCDLIGHKYEDEDCREYGYCSRCHFNYTELDMDIAYDNAPWWVWLLPAHAYDLIYHTFKRVICRIWGHDWYEDGYAGPDSGHTWVECRRCGESHTTYLY